MRDMAKSGETDSNGAQMAAAKPHDLPDPVVNPTDHLHLCRCRILTLNRAQSFAMPSHAHDCGAYALGQGWKQILTWRSEETLSR